MLARSAQRLLILGWDDADWQVIDPLKARAQMPNLARLLAAGTRADLRTLEPKLSPIARVTYALDGADMLVLTVEPRAQEGKPAEAPLVFRMSRAN